MRKLIRSDRLDLEMQVHEGENEALDVLKTSRFRESACNKVYCTYETWLKDVPQLGLAINRLCVPSS